MLLAKRVCWYLVVRGVWLLGCPMVTSLISEGIAWPDTSDALCGFGAGTGNPSRDKKSLPCSMGDVTRNFRELRYEPLRSRKTQFSR